MVDFEILLINRFPCTRAPLIGSKPHFLDADEELLAAVDGLVPNRLEHDLFFHLEMVRNRFFILTAF
jgi:hypothetical protein